ncbi:MAG: endonuclease/exonuclease/phosphatase family protein [Paracoccaceae bacterium]
MTLRLATYNVHKCIGMDRRRSPERILAVLAALKADILALQEVDHRIGARPEALPRALIAQGTPYAVAGHATGERSLGWHGQAILVRRDWPIRDVARIDLPSLEPRGAILAEIDTAFGLLRVVGVHLGLIRRLRLLQLATIALALAARPPMPSAILGDWNEWSRKARFGAVSENFRILAPGASFPALRPVGRLDRIALGPGLGVGAAGVLSGGQARLASDHLPVWAEVGWEGV